MKLTPTSFSVAAMLFVAPAVATTTVPPAPQPVSAAPMSPASTSSAATLAAPVELQVPVVDRATWGAQGGLGAALGTVDEVVIHHFWKPSMPEVASPAREADLMRQVEKTHVEGNGWSGFGYNFVVFQSGRVYEGRGWGRVGAHTVGQNDRTVGIAFAIDGDRHAPTPEAWAAAKAIIEDGVAQGHVTPDAAVTGHSDYAPKSCPGRSITPHLDTLVPGTA